MTTLPHDKTAIVLFNLGGPTDLAAVEPFLINLFSDREIIELPGGAFLQPYMARLIAKMRGRGVRENYQRIGGGSPQLRITQAQAAALEEELNYGLRETRYRVFIAMRYSQPTSMDALEAVHAAGIRRIVTLTLFPHFSKATTGSSRNEFDRALHHPRWANAGFEVSHIDAYPDDERYLDAMADTVREAWEQIPADRRNRTVVLFSAHGLPQKFIDEGDPYVAHIEATRYGILQRLDLPNRQLLAYQSRTGPVKWLGPGTEEVIEELGRDGVRDLLIVPLSFVSDHIETLYEVDQLFLETAKEAGIEGYYRPKQLNTHPLFIDALAGLVRTHLTSPTASPERELTGALAS